MAAPRKHPDELGLIPPVELGRGPLEPATPGVPSGLTRQIVRFAAVGVANTLA